MNAARAQAQGLEQTIEVGDRPAADERERASELAFGPAKRRNETRRRHDVVRPLRQIEQRAVDVEKKRERLVAQRRHILHRRARKGRRAQLTHSQTPDAPRRT